LPRDHERGREEVAKNATKPNLFNPLNAELNPICHLLALLAHHILHGSRIRVKIIPLQTTRKENNWKPEETLAGAAVSLETERIKGSNP
jgi:hypothetical protein